uniref:Uncharacterized protein n=1 Tax=Helianthus annuus TaxID=4232 RepID=A0A251UKE5_HELAN
MRGQFVVFHGNCNKFVVFNTSYLRVFGFKPSVLGPFHCLVGTQGLLSNLRSCLLG